MVLGSRVMSRLLDVESLSRQRVYDAINFWHVPFESFRSPAVVELCLRYYRNPFLLVT